MNELVMSSCCVSIGDTEMTKAKLQVLIDSDLKKFVAKIAIDRETSIGALVEQALRDVYVKAKNPV